MLYNLDRAAGPQVLGDWLGQQKDDVAAWSSRTPTGTHCKDGDGKINGASELKYIGMGACPRPDPLVLGEQGLRDVVLRVPANRPTANGGERWREEHLRRRRDLLLVGGHLWRPGRDLDEVQGARRRRERAWTFDVRGDSDGLLECRSQDGVPIWMDLLEPHERSHVLDEVSRHSGE